MSIVRVANLAGVSKSTVSRVINHSDEVTPAVGRAVREAMRSIGYQPSARRRGPKPLSRRGIRTGNIAMLVMGRRPANLYRAPVLPALLDGVERALAEHGLNLVLASLAADEDLPPILRSRQADGLLLLGKWDGMPENVRAALRAFPAVWILREHSDVEGEFDHVFYRNAAVGRIAARYLRGRGHRRMGFLNLEAHHAAFAQRQEDFVEAIRAAEGERAEVVAIGAESTDAASVDGASTIDRLLERLPAPFGLFVAADAQVPGVYHALESRGLRPGKDVDVICCDNEEQFLSKLSPRPATIDIAPQLVGRRGVQQLLWRMRNPGERNRISVLVEPRLVLPEESKASASRRSVQGSAEDTRVRS